VTIMTRLGISLVLLTFPLGCFVPPELSEGEAASSGGSTGHDPPSEATTNSTDGGGSTSWDAAAMNDDDLEPGDDAPMEDHVSTEGGSTAVGNTDRLEESTDSSTERDVTGSLEPSTSEGTAASSETVTGSLEPSTSEGTATSSETVTGSLEPSTSEGTAASSETETGDVVESAPDFFDDFDRLPSFDIGNSWIEKTPEIFQLRDGQIQAEVRGNDGFYNNHVVHRGMDAARTDIEVRLEFEITEYSPGNEPYVVIRLTAESLESGSFLTGYSTSARPGPRDLCIFRFGNGLSPRDQRCVVWPFEEIPINVPHAIRLVATGSDPVELRAHLERFDGERGIWEDLMEVAWTDDVEGRIGEGGAWGFGGGVERFNVANYVIDNVSARFPGN